MRWCLIPVALLTLTLAACPEERPGATKEIPSQRIPPAMSLEPALTPRAGADAGTVAPQAIPALPAAEQHPAASRNP